MNLKKRFAASILIAIGFLICLVLSAAMYEAIGIIGCFIIPGFILFVGGLSWSIHTLLYDDE